MCCFHHRPSSLLPLLVLILPLVASAAEGDGSTRKAVDTGKTIDKDGEFNPFGPTTAVRDDAQPGCVEFSDGSRVAGQIYLTRDQRLVIYDEQLQRQREVPLETIRQIDCKVKREWMEREYRFKATTTDEKVYSGRSYPVREYLHTITLRGGRTITGPISGIVFIEPSRELDQGEAAKEATPSLRVILHKRDKGEFGAELKSLVYAKSIKLGKEALAQGSRKAPAASKPDTEKPSADEPAPAKQE